MSDWTPLQLSLQVSLMATALALLAGTAAAWWLSRGRRTAGKQLAETLFLLPLVLPPTVVGYYLLAILGRGTSFGRFLNDSAGIHLLFTWPGAAVAASAMALPLYIRTATAAFREVDEELLETARMLGAPEIAVLRHVIIPLSYRGLLAGSGLAFARALGEFGATLMVAGNIPGVTQTLPLALYSAVLAGHDREALTLTVVLTLTAVILVSLVGLYEGGISARRSAS